MDDEKDIAPALAYLGLGSNLGERRANLDDAVARVGAHPDVCVLIVAEPLETAPMYVTDQPRFLNTCAAVQTTLAPRELLAWLLQVELDMGRERTQAKGPRSIDIDLLFYGDYVIDEPGLTVPHPGILERDFVLRPLSQIARDFVHPSTGRTIAEHAASLD